uniref:Uncharacterized protein n=1 Tax=Cannabis sativa TaxID=3483 RepID=A0A803Q217_CANSA
MSPREDPPLAPPNDGGTHEEKPLGTTTRSGPQYYAGETGLRICEPAIGEPYLDLEGDLELSRLREIVCQVSQTREPRAVGSD